MKTLALILAALLAAFGASPASATMIRWEGTASIQRNIDFATLGQVAGYFDFDTVSATIVGVNMTFTPVAGALHPLNGDPLPIFTANAVAGIGATGTGAMGAHLVDWSDGPDFAGDYLLAVFEADGFGQVGQTLDQMSLRICAVSDCRISSGQGMSGSAIAFTSRDLSVAVPEPVSGLLLVTGLAALAAVRHRRRRDVA
ncbi:MAG: hypothetical protein BroJett029_17750 [Alphaproteobacteria bacterium]|nr:MAG: hypothetical protein BroJett029_17750 [Alphaproteobacteria bacterium]